MPKAKQAKEAKKKEKAMSFYGVNIKVRSEKRTINESVYAELFEKIATTDFTLRVAGDKAVTLNRCVSVRATHKGAEHVAYYGTIVRYIILEGSHWYNRGKKTVENFTVPAGFFPNAFEAEYLFVPAAHRFFFRTSGKVTINMVHQFLEEGFKEIAQKDEDVKVNIMTSHDFIDKIINSSGLQNLSISISYTNDDLGDSEYDAWMDGLLKEAHAGEFDVNVKPDATGVIKTDSPIVQGMLGVAKENGTAKARIILPNGGTEVIKAQKYPSKIVIKVGEDDDPNKVLFNNVMVKYRNKDE